MADTLFDTLKERFGSVIASQLVSGGVNRIDHPAVTAMSRIHHTATTNGLTDDSIRRLVSSTERANWPVYNPQTGMRLAPADEQRIRTQLGVNGLNVSQMMLRTMEMERDRVTRLMGATHADSIAAAARVRHFQTLQTDPTNVAALAALRADRFFTERALALDTATPLEANPTRIGTVAPPGTPPIELRRPEINGVPYLQHTSLEPERRPLPATDATPHATV